jgi:hypothetical protein
MKQSKNSSLCLQKLKPHLTDSCPPPSLLDSECGRKLPNRLPNFCLIDTGNCLILCLIACLIARRSRYRNLGFILIGDALRATPEMGTFVPNGRRHGAPAKIASQIRQTIRQTIRQFPAEN